MNNENKNESSCNLDTTYDMSKIKIIYPDLSHTENEPKWVTIHIDDTQE